MNAASVIAIVSNACPTSGRAVACGAAYPGANDQLNHHAAPGGGSA